MRKTNYRGIAGAVRRGINGGDIVGQITFGAVRGLLPSEKADAPNKVIEKSLKNLALNNEIIEKAGQFYTKDAAAETPKAVSVIVTGKLISSVVRDGKMIVTIEATSIDNS